MKGNYKQTNKTKQKSHNKVGVSRLKKKNNNVISMKLFWVLPLSTIFDYIRYHSTQWLFSMENEKRLVSTASLSASLSCGVFSQVI